MPMTDADALVKLTPLAPEDLDTLFQWINDPELVAYNARFEPVSWEDHLRWYNSLSSREDLRIFAIRKRADARLIGTCQLRNIDLGHRTAELVIRIGERSCWGRGLGTQALRLLLQHAFDELGLMRVGLFVFADNLRALRTYEKVGFVQEGRLRQAVEIGDQRKDLLVMGVLRDEFCKGEAK